MLARREHSQKELQLKLKKRDFDDDAILEVLTALSNSNLQSDVRYTEAFVRSRVQRGHGPRRIRLDLAARGVSESLIERGLSEADCDWEALARAVRIKKFGETPATDWNEKAKQAKFLEYRGFDGCLVRET